MTAPATDAVKLLVHVLRGGMLPPTAASVQVLPENEPVGALNVTRPVGLLAPRSDVSRTVAVQIIATPTVGVADAQVTTVIVG
jgi:hypothetical protein